MSKTKKAHRAKVAKRNQRIQNEQKQFQKVLEQIKQAQEFARANGDEGPGYRLQEDTNQARPTGMPHFLPLTGSETYNPDKEVWVGGASAPQSWKINKG
jgi:hypothetical protein